MPTHAATAAADRGQRRASFQQARSHETKRALVQAAASLWRANGYADTTVADICRAAGVSKGLFYFYFPRKEDLIGEVGILSSQSARRAAHSLLAKPYDLEVVVTAVLQHLERSMRRNPPELVIESILEGYRLEHRVLAGDEPPADAELLFTEVLERAQADGNLPPHVDVVRLAQLAESLVSEGARHSAAGAYGKRSFSKVVGGDIAMLIAGASQPKKRRL